MNSIKKHTLAVNRKSEPSRILMHYTELQKFHNSATDGSILLSRVTPISVDPFIAGHLNKMEAKISR
jgi:hypothetical protein